MIVVEAYKEAGSYEVKMLLTKEQVQTLQDAIDYSAWQFEEGGADSDESIQFLRDLHKEIKGHTGIESTH